MLSLRKEADEEDADDEQSCCKSCLNTSWTILKEMGNVSLLGKNFAFLLITLSNFFIFSGYFIPFIYVPVRAKALDITNYSLILSVIGIVNIPARLLFGTLADKVSPTNLNSLCAILASLALWFYAPLTTFATQCVFSVVFAIGIAGTNCLTTPYLKDIVGMEKFSNAMGIVNLFRGFGCFLGPYIAGIINFIFVFFLI
jgi:predicted MFS family arabinose efflux permease